MLKRIALARITRNPDQPRQVFDAAALSDLADSIAENGLMQPITVRPIPKDAEGHDYMIVAGERRFRAHLILSERGQASDILAHVRRMGEDEMQINAILENLQRADISPFEEAMAYRRALDELGLDVASLARRLGISQHWRITDRLRLLGLTEDNRALVAKGVISMTQAYHMAALSPNGQQAFVKIAMQGHATTYEAARAAAEMIASKEAQVEMFAPAPKRQSIRSLEDRIEQIGGALQPMFKDGPFRIQGAIDPGAGERCLEKIRLLRKHLAQVENELLKAVSVSVAA